MERNRQRQSHLFQSNLDLARTRVNTAGRSHLASSLTICGRLLVAPGSHCCHIPLLIHAAPPIPHVSAFMPSYYVLPVLLPSCFALRCHLVCQCVNFACLGLRRARSLYISVGVIYAVKDQPQEDHTVIFVFFFLSHYTMDDVSLSNTHKQTSEMCYSDQSAVDKNTVTLHDRELLNR